MMTATQPRTEPNNFIVDPKRFNLWLAIISSTMLFAALTSAYIVKRAEGNWNAFIIPEQFIYSTVIVILSSITMQWAMWAAKRDEIGQVKTAMWSTLILGVAFGISQFMGWNVLVKNNMYFASDDVAVSFFYTITAFHFVHVFGGWIAASRVVWKTYKLEIHKKSLRAISMCATYWHFMGVLWIYLYLFLFLNR
ncbi:MAG: cytochrome c oxidase subunit 3 [Bacteroidota bacterium]|nr:cytochrome c oxidase subunit 3 [Bacteroidota bacterium]MDX5429822.1 cytochrome c oxidase subunit 3 [Bacteroidota bacterium]MDX5468601.1 cytochrome c oxidase subunit 3 [Bacteroidota bacterium]